MIFAIVRKYYATLLKLKLLFKSYDKEGSEKNLLITPRKM